MLWHLSQLHVNMTWRELPITNNKKKAQIHYSWISQNPSLNARN